MGKGTGITWAHHTFNGVWGCVERSPACDLCYAREFAKRLGLDLWGAQAERRTFGDTHWNEPLRWDRAAAKAGERHRVFAYSMGDWAERHPTTEAQLPRLFALIRATPNLDWLLLTKRHERIRRSLPADWGPSGYPNVWLGVTAEDQHYVDLRTAVLMDIPAAVHWVSAEPLLGPIRRLPRGLDWIVYGGESGTDAARRAMPMHDLETSVTTARHTGTRIFVKQDSDRKAGRRGAIPDELWLKEFPDQRTVADFERLIGQDVAL